MDNYFNQSVEDDGSEFTASGDSGLQYSEVYQGNSFDPTFNLDHALDEYTASPFNPTSTRPSSLHSAPQHSGQESPTSVPYNQQPLVGRRTMRLSPMPVKPRQARALSPDAIERRRRQNRASQIAFRERKRKKTGELHQELAVAARYNVQMHSTMRDLLSKTEELKSAIEQALATQPPSVSDWSASGQSGADYQAWSLSDSEGPMEMGRERSL